jgi:peptidoglycan/LPS O-acetylase OafA/YrhL
MKKLFFFGFVRPKFHNPIIDGVRAWGLIMVLLGHLLHFYNPFFTEIDETRQLSKFFDFFRADLAVDAFFVISGFLIGSILFKEYQKNLSLSFKRFYLSRFFRLMPVYFVCVFLGIIFYFLIKNSNSDMAPQIDLMLGNFWTNLLYVNNFIPVQEQFMGWCWSLAIEEQFYLLVPLFIVGLFKWIKQKVWFFIILFFLSFAVRFYVVYHYNLVGEGFWGEDITSDSWRNTFNLLYDNLYTRYGGLLVGILGSYFYMYYLDRLKKFFEDVSFSRVLYFLSVFVFLIIFFKVDFIYFSELTKTGVTITATDLSFYEKIYFSIIVACSRNLFALSVMYIIFYVMFSLKGRGSLLAKALSSHFLFPLAQLSYSAYLIHPFIIIPVSRYLTPCFFAYLDNVYYVFILNSVIALVLIYLLSLALHVFIEKPFMEMRKSSFFKKITE